MMGRKRVNTKRSAVDMGQAISAAFNQYSGGMKQTDAGPALEIIGTLAAEKAVGIGASLWVYNNAGAVGWITFYSGTGAAPTPSGLSNAIAVPPNSYLKVNSGLNGVIVGSAATLGVYKILDDTSLTVDDNQGT